MCVTTFTYNKKGLHSTAPSGNHASKLFPQKHTGFSQIGHQNYSREGGKTFSLVEYYTQTIPWVKQMVLQNRSLGEPCIQIIPWVKHMVTPKHPSYSLSQENAFSKIVHSGNRRSKLIPVKANVFSKIVPWGNVASKLFFGSRKWFLHNRSLWEPCIQTIHKNNILASPISVLWGTWHPK